MKSIYNSIKKDIETHPDVATSVLGEVSSWKRSHFILLSELISERLATSELITPEKKYELGNTISHMTLQRFFENDYHEKTHNDLRFLKTLEKLCIFLGEEDLNSYVKKKSETRVVDSQENLPEDYFQELIINFCRAQFEASKLLPKCDLSPIHEYVFQNSPLYERVKSFIEEQSKKKLTLITKNNRSNFEIFRFNLISSSEDLQVIETHEFWNLLFDEKKSGEKYIINRLNTQTYFIKKLEGKWKIWDNYNPNTGQIVKT